MTYKILKGYTNLDPGRFFTLDRLGQNLRPFLGGGPLRHYLSSRVVPYYNAVPAEFRIPRNLNRFTNYVNTEFEFRG